MVRSDIAHLHPEYRRLVEQQPYEVFLDGLRITVARDVFPPDLGRCARNLAKILLGYAPKSALEVGCGSGYLALTLKRAGAVEVWATDIHEPAVACARANGELNPEAAPITVLQSDVFDSVPRTVKFDLIVFNQPYAPGLPARI